MGTSGVDTTSSTANNTSSAVANPLSATAPSMQQYDILRKSLRDLISKKKTIDRNLEQLEDHIYKFETSYLEETQNGNIVRGFDNYIKGTVARRRANITDTDRVFSNSSYSFQKSREDSSSSSGTPRGSVPPESATSVNTPGFPKSAVSIGSTLKKSGTAVKNKKRKGGVGSMTGASGPAGGNEESEDSHSDTETPGPKRVRISFSGQNNEK